MTNVGGWRRFWELGGAEVSVGGASDRDEDEVEFLGFTPEEACGRYLRGRSFGDHS